MGNASWGNKVEQLPVGDYPAIIRGVSLTEGPSFNDPNKLKKQFEWALDVKVNGHIENRKAWTPRSITNMAEVKNPQFVSGLNRLIRACGKPVPQTADAVDAWSEESLVGSKFILRMEEDEETGTVVRRYVPFKTAPQAAEAPAEQRIEAPATREYADGEDPFSDE